MGEGLIGAFIVREPDASDPNSDLYDEDSSDHVLVISDWTDINLVEIYESEMHDRYLAVLPISGNKITLLIYIIMYTNSWAKNYI